MGALIAFILAVIGGAVGYGRLNRNVETNSERLTSLEDDKAESKDVENAWGALKQMRDWKDVHEREEGIHREQFNKEISELKGSLLVSGEQFKQILAFLQDLKERMIKLENK